MKQEIISIVTDMLYVIFVVSILSFLWWGPYQDKVRAQQSYQGTLNQTTALKTTGFDKVVVSDDKVTQDISIANVSDDRASYTISFMVEDGKMNQDSNQNNYVFYQVIDDNGTMSDIRNLSLDGYMITSNLPSNSSKHYQIILWSESSSFDGAFSLIANPIL